MRKKVYLLKKLLLVLVVLGEDPFITHLLQLLERDFRGSKSGYYIRSVSQDDEISGVVVLVLCSFSSTGTSTSLIIVVQHLY